MFEELTLSTRGDGDVHDLTESAQAAVERAGLGDGVCIVFVAHSTCAVTTIEAEPGCNADLKWVLDELAPPGRRWEHNVRNHDTNGHAHVGAAFLGPSVTLPVRDGRLVLGTWQRVVCVDLDDRPRSRRVVIELLGG